MVINDKEFGEIILADSVRARRIIVRRKADKLYLTYPVGTTLSYIEKTIDEMRPRLRKMMEQKTDIYQFSPDKSFDTFSFKLKLTESHTTDNYYLKLKDGILSISYPSNTDFGNKEVQNTLKQSVEKAFRYEANRLFPAKVEMLAQKHGFTYSEVKINKSRTRWGSCSYKKSINLSYYCMLLPEYLVDFIILHELCHTVEMNHGKNFWNLLDKVTEGKARQLTAELKSHKTAW